MIYQHPLAYLIGLEGDALLRSWAGQYDEDFVHARLAEVDRLMRDETLRTHPGVWIGTDATADAYRRWAPGYDDPGNGLLTLDIAHIGSALDALPTGDAVDVACGTGRITRLLIDRGHRTLGVDPSPEMLEIARRSVPGARFEKGDAVSVPLDDGSCTVLTCALALTHVADLPGALCEFARVLRPGGTAVITDVHPDLVRLGSTVKAESATGQPLLAATHGHSVADHLRAALSAGFDVVEFDELGQGRSERQTVAAEEDLDDWRQWPWTLLGRAPGAALAAWEIPSMMAWRLVRR